jgi:hypothetical protein
MRWVQLRGQLLRGEKPNGRHGEGLRRIDQRLREVSTDVMSIPVCRSPHVPRGSYPS